MWIECDDFTKVPEGTWLGTAIETDCNNQKILVKIEVDQASNYTLRIVDGHHASDRDYLKLLAYCEPPKLFGE
ncbi:hypothetical protein pEaSNUABM50_00429 [Erwinia phage pEa_SNUABM_50]|uniref:Uncharacterized protein n=4 Tax=Eneladusvirus BF TaxID=2560751 RepID=A0A7L8ZN41_9CAUD|nr:hypothetical protein FDH34_gp495 [Serratia phage BF]QOI71364.1 hypothetical protein pEaSNUABM12_00435 [Erwinia phage pEa_SNUABM_12]QOI71906.1 hypothetical protein pEaSNUABM47_00431 [Erwinia phage pEa_SNUABM_47]QOI72445.1 hypothetical protein pEaSNUABM50_00429 [Erwinia phage pEa_SNUABM_50]QXO11572.1 hypothetical protein pEaSNUABM19_00435 [Erwinia phage pEa_SNUABM_19]QXO12120.1 hypothetical protein pEaSNUABM44_00433 [Erwinia phage pEa_SNUABM_44]QXO12673.1 hypothetical protein pEaSNUABM49_004